LGRTRETLFNWLRPYLHDCTCLDLFAGSGALGFEAASLGASSVTLVDANKTIAEALSANISLLKADNCQAVHSRAEQFLRSAQSPYDVIFLDPPYKQPQLMESALDALAKSGLIGGHVYLEAESDQALLELCERFSLNVIKTTSAGATHSVLAAP
jgi:16S rRNA (guanine966-N2)-methyltransferase